MNHREMLVRLLSQAQEEGGKDLVTLRAIVEEASDLGAERVLDRLGLSEDVAKEDLAELRELLQAWRDAKSSATKAIITWSVRAILAMLLLGLAVRFGFGGSFS